MGSGIFHIDEKNRLVELNEAPYESEDLLQELLERHPELLAGSQISSDSPRRWLLIRREMGIPGEENGCDRWSADHVFVDQDGIPTFVEVKRSSDTRIRREVVGQMLDYAANAVVYWPAEQLREEFEKNCIAQDDDSSEQLSNLIGDNSDPEDFWRKVQTNLDAERLRLLFVSDQIPAELKRIVEFLNGQMERAEVLAVEIKQYVGEGGGRSLVPRVFGKTSYADNAKGTVRKPKRKWDKASFRKHIAENASTEAAAVADNLIEWTENNIGEPRWGSGATMASFSASFAHNDNHHVLFDVWSRGSFSLRFTRLRRFPPFDDLASRTSLMNKFNEISGIQIQNPDGWQEHPLELLSSPSVLEHFLEIIRYMMTEIRKQE